jgi:hypothetical protein
MWWRKAGPERPVPTGRRRDSTANTATTARRRRECRRPSAPADSTTQTEQRNGTLEWPSQQESTSSTATYRHTQRLDVRQPRDQVVATADNQDKQFRAILKAFEVMAIGGQPLCPKPFKGAVADSTDIEK